MGKILLIIWGCIAGEKHTDLKINKEIKNQVENESWYSRPDRNRSEWQVCGIGINNLPILSKAFVVPVWCTIEVIRAMQRGPQNNQSDYLGKWQIIYKIRYRVYKKPYFSGEFDAIQEHSKRILEEKALSH